MQWQLDPQSHGTSEVQGVLMLLHSFHTSWCSHLRTSVQLDPLWPITLWRVQDSIPCQLQRLFAELKVLCIGAGAVHTTLTPCFVSSSHNAKQCPRTRSRRPSDGARPMGWCSRMCRPHAPPCSPPNTIPHHAGSHGTTHGAHPHEGDAEAGARPRD